MTAGIDRRLQDAYGQIDIDDLHDPEASAGIVLEMQDRQRYFEGGISSTVAGADTARKVCCNLFFAALLTIQRRWILNLSYGMQK